MFRRIAIPVYMVVSSDARTRICNLDGWHIELWVSDVHIIGWISIDSRGLELNGDQ